MGFLRGTAACRGTYWAVAVLERVHDRRPWPPYDGRCRAIALSKIDDLTRDTTLREDLARVAHSWAARRWAA